MSTDAPDAPDAAAIVAAAWWSELHPDECVRDARRAVLDAREAHRRAQAALAVAEAALRAAEAAFKAQQRLEAARAQSNRQDR
ncbi:hypothetical protein [Azohydromonas sediminis]|uniref:hypothetical protein n=1 Tax=Azohydromonas sediminis TaxID=2259674 RepID=UPI000E656B39|nr:hypothetical protein [Azohydromonas sediminis]